MKIILILTLFILLFGCTEFENLTLDGDPVYQCRISTNPQNPDCGDSWGGHMCQIYDPFYSLSAGIPDHCTTFCLNRSDYLNSYEPECIMVSVQDSLFAIEDDQTPKTYLKKIVSNLNLDIVEEEIEDECNAIMDGVCPDTCGSDDDFDCCESYGKTWVDGVCQVDSSKCQFNSDCEDTCSENLIIENYCDNSTFTCKTKNTTDCSIEKETIIGKKYAKTCVNLECVLNKTELQKDQLEISNSWKEHNDLRQELTKLEVLMDDIMLKQAEGLTQELMISTYSALNLISGNFIQLLTDLTVNSIEEGLSALGSGDEASMNKGETFAWAYNNREKIRTELNVVDAKLTLLSNSNKEIIEKINSLN